MHKVGRHSSLQRTHSVKVEVLPPKRVKARKASSIRTVVWAAFHWAPPAGRRTLVPVSNLGRGRGGDISATSGTLSTDTPLPSAGTCAASDIHEACSADTPRLHCHRPSISVSTDKGARFNFLVFVMDA